MLKLVWSCGSNCGVQHLPSTSNSWIDFILKCYVWMVNTPWFVTNNIIRSGHKIPSFCKEKVRNYSIKFVHRQTENPSKQSAYGVLTGQTHTRRLKRFKSLEPVASFN